MSKLEWFKWKAGAVDNAKLRLLAREDRWNFVAVCCLKARGELDSNAPLLERRVAVSLELTPAEAVEVKRRLMEVGLIDDQWQPLSWVEHQPSVDNTAADRKRRQRERERMSQNVTRDARDGHSIELELETELEEEKNSTDVLAVNSPLEAALSRGTHEVFELRSEAEPERASVKTAKTPKTASAEARGTRIGEFLLTPVRWKFAEQQGLIDPKRTHMIFCNHWRAKPGREGRKVDWDATWENWCLKDAQDQRTKRGFNPRQEPPRAQDFPA